MISETSNNILHHQEQARPVKRKSLLGMNITWDEPSHTSFTEAYKDPCGGITAHHPHKLKKKVSFAQPRPVTPSSPDPPLPKTPSGKGFSLFKKSNWVVSAPMPDTTLAGGPPSPASSESSAASWHHHDSYFPEYEPLFPSAGGADGKWASPFSSMLTPAEIRRQHHAAVLGEAVAIHYPDLPSWADYTAKAGGDKDKAKVGWQSGKWGTEGWTGYGWEGEKLPTADGMTFGLPMAKGVEIKKPEGQGKKKKKGKGGGGGGNDGGDDAEEGGDGDGDD